MKQKQHVIALAVLVLLATLAVAALVGCDKTVEITFDPGNGASPTSVTLTAGEVLTAPQDPVRRGIHFSAGSSAGRNTPSGQSAKT